MKPYELVAKTIRGENNAGVTPLYGWVDANLSEQISSRFGSVRNFEDFYGFDMAHIFGGPSCYNHEQLEKLRAEGVEITPEVLLSVSMNDPCMSEDYDGVREALSFHKNSRERFCYVQTPGVFECSNDPFGIENQLCYMALYPEELREVYRRRTDWNLKYISNMIELGVHMIHFSDDWGAQSSLLFSPRDWWEMVYPCHKKMVDFAKSYSVFASLHSDGNVSEVLDGIADIGYDLMHPYQESAGMSYQVYLEKYAEKFAILGGLCVQTTVGFGDYTRLESEIRRVFSLLKNKRWIFCTTHFVQEHCSMDELVFAYDLAKKLCCK